ncbi:Hypothetical predicted protein [Prunus dulcis]|uniref:Uncharacterized protein n=1 Tax=Prunus dulcis TaxID=3755 RepID=A0A5E4E7S1_PRUDU|nr:Hypothetical predicted protein [Prunus dulcis]
MEDSRTKVTGRQQCRTEGQEERVLTTKVGVVVVVVVLGREGGEGSGLVSTLLKASA